MINDTEKSKSRKRRDAAILCGACAFAIGLGALAQVLTVSDDPLAQPTKLQEAAQTQAINTMPQDVERSTENVGWTPDEFASLADEIFEDASKQADAAFGGEEESTESVAVDGKAVDGMPVDGKPKDASASAQQTYVLPMGTDIVKDFSMGVPVFSATMEDWRTHNGVDFGGKAGDLVMSAAAGTVTAVYEDASWGGVVELDFGNGVTAKYCGLQFDSIPLAVGDSVLQGEEVGALGVIPIEKTDGEHLHYEMRVNGVIADPLETMGRGGSDE